MATRGGAGSSIIAARTAWDPAGESAGLTAELDQTGKSGARLFLSCSRKWGRIWAESTANGAGDGGVDR
jgi:hypothetical protein